MGCWHGLALIAAAVAGSCAVDRELKAALEIDYCAEHQLWTDVISKTGNLPPRLYSPCVNHDLNPSIVPYGPLAVRSCSPIRKYTCPCSRTRSVPRAALMRKPLDLLLELGRVNEAEHVALEMLEEVAMRRNTQAAGTGQADQGPNGSRERGPATYCGMIVVWGRWADEYLHRVAADPTLAHDDEIQRTRQLMIVEDDPPMAGKPASSGDAALPCSWKSCWQRNSGNRMAPSICWR